MYVTDDKGAVQALDRTTGASVWKQELLAARKIGGPQIVGDQVGVVDIEGYLHLLSAVNGAYVGRLATDGSAPSSQPVGFGWQRVVAVRGGHALLGHGRSSVACCPPSRWSVGRTSASPRFSTA